MPSLRLTDFDARIKAPFTLQGPPQPLELRLEEARPLGHGVREGGAFSLLFLGPARPILPQATYRLEHAEMGAMDIFLVPVGPQAGGMGYEAVFT